MPGTTARPPLAGATRSPDGTRLVYFGSRDYGTGIWVVAEQGGSRELIVSCYDCKWPRWSPVKNDRRIIYSTKYSLNGREYTAINIVNSDGSNRKSFLDSDRHGGSALRVSWSPDAKQIVFNSMLLTGFNDLVVANADGSNPQGLGLGELYGYASGWAR